MGMGGKTEEKKIEMPSGMELERKKKKKKQKGEDSKDGIFHVSNKGDSNQKVEVKNGNQTKKSNEVSVKMETHTLMEVEGKKKKQKGEDSKDGISHVSNKGDSNQKLEDKNGNQTKKSNEVSVKIETHTLMGVEGKKKKQKQKRDDVKDEMSHEITKGPNEQKPSQMEEDGEKKKLKGAGAKNEVSHKSNKMSSKQKSEDVNGFQSKKSDDVSGKIEVPPSPMEVDDDEVSVKMEMPSVMKVNGEKKKQKSKKGETKLKEKDRNDELSKKCDKVKEKVNMPSVSEAERKKKEQKREGINDPVLLQSKQGSKVQNAGKADGEVSVKSKKAEEKRNLPSVMSLVLSYVSRRYTDPALNEFVNEFIVEENDVTLEDVVKCYLESKGE